MDYSNLQLRNKTFLDFTDDDAIIDKIIGERESFLPHLTERARAHTFLLFAELTPDKNLAAAIEKEFERELECMFPE
jgi:hypothetical protein